jgi:hypothetical protein
MAASNANQQRITQTIDAVHWAVNSDDEEAARETRRRARQVGPDCIAFLSYALRSDEFASPTQRIRCASTLLEVGQFLSFEAKVTGLFGAADSDGSGEREAS